MMESKKHKFSHLICLTPSIGPFRGRSWSSPPPGTWRASGSLTRFSCRASSDAFARNIYPYRLLFQAARGTEGFLGADYNLSRATQRFRSTEHPSCLRWHRRISQHYSETCSLPGPLCVECGAVVLPHDIFASIASRGSLS